MKKLYICLTFLIFFGLGTNNANAQYLRVKFQNGTEETREINLLKNLKFPDNLLQIKYINGTADSYELSSISTLYFQLYPTGTKRYRLIGNLEISVYPNPAKDILYLKNVPKNKLIASVYRIDGFLVLQKQIAIDNNSIDISSLINGFYFLRIDNQAFKFIKQ